MTDMDYLLLLQEFRHSTNDIFTPFFEMLSRFSVSYLIIVPAFIYWCLSKRNGLYIFASYSSSIALNAVIKLTACVYRPWIRDSRIVPAGNAVNSAIGYSFPSGHTSTAVPIYGGIALAGRKKVPAISVICIACALLTAFSRNYLGVHTPQDVAAGIATSLLTLFGMSKLFGYLSSHPEKENRFLLAGEMAGMLALIYFSFKKYPLDYADGKLLVDPYLMMKSGYGDIGKFMGFCAARFIEKTWIRYEPDRSAKNFVAGAVGAALAVILLRYLGKPLNALLGLHWGLFMENVLVMCYMIAVWPAVMKAICQRKKQHNNV